MIDNKNLHCKDKRRRTVSKVIKERIFVQKVVFLYKNKKK